MPTIIAPSASGIALLCINAVFCTFATTAYILRFTKNLSKARAKLLPWAHFILTDSLVFAATAFINSPLPLVSAWLKDYLDIGTLEWCLADRL